MSNYLTARQREEMRETLKRTIDWVKFADTKAAAIGAILGIYIGLSKEIVVKAFSTVMASYDQPIPYLTEALSAAIVLSLAYVFGRTMWFVTHAIRARTTNNSASLIFFGHIATLALPAFHHQVKAASENDLDKTLVDQVYANSEIASKKFKYINESIASIILASIVLALCALATPIK